MYLIITIAITIMTKPPRMNKGDTERSDSNLGVLVVSAQSFMTVIPTIRPLNVRQAQRIHRVTMWKVDGSRKGCVGTVEG